jgi:catechol 2,3-dioxygenase-like lactoylglutathione lyase family enzyme
LKRLWTIIGVRDVPASLAWYQKLLDRPQTPPAHEDFGQVVDADGTVLLCLHEWGEHGHPSLMSPAQGATGTGLLLFFRVDNFDRVLNSARTLVERLEEEPHISPNTHTEEFSLIDPDGYYVSISALGGA